MVFPCGCPCSRFVKRTNLTYEPASLNLPLRCLDIDFVLFDVYWSWSCPFLVVDEFRNAKNLLSSLCVFIVWANPIQRTQWSWNHEKPSVWVYIMKWYSWSIYIYLYKTRILWEDSPVLKASVTCQIHSLFSLCKFQIQI